MLSSFTILLFLTSILSPAFGIPSPRGRIGGGGFRSGGSRGSGEDSSGESSSGSSGGNTYIAAGGVFPNSGNGYSTYSAPVPDDGDHVSYSCDYHGANATDAFVQDPAWITSMTGCLNVMNASNWSGTKCAPPTGGVTFGFWKGEDDYSDPVDCFNRCAGCLGSAINASQAVTTKCQYEYRTSRSLVGYKTHTCSMGYDKGK